jgi:hypothetical protein
VSLWEEFPLRRYNDPPQERISGTEYDFRFSQNDTLSTYDSRLACQDYSKLNRIPLLFIMCRSQRRLAWDGGFPYSQPSQVLSGTPKNSDASRWLMIAIAPSLFLIPRSLDRNFRSSRILFTFMPQDYAGELSVSISRFNGCSSF